MKKSSADSGAQNCKKHEYFGTLYELCPYLGGVPRGFFLALRVFLKEDIR